MTVNDIITELQRFAPLELAEDWDNVGLLLGDTEQSVAKIMTCLTLTPDVAKEAIRENVQLIVTHHPILFRPVKCLTTETSEGRMLLSLAKNEVAVYSPHTAFDSAKFGINAWLCDQLGIQEPQSIRPIEQTDDLGAGRFGMLAEPTSLDEFLTVVKTKFNLANLQFIGDRASTVQNVAVACGSAAEFLEDTARLGCDTFITGEARFHACLGARTLGVNMILLGHYASERPAVEFLAQYLQQKFESIEAFSSHDETDPLEFG